MRQSGRRIDYREMNDPGLDDAIGEYENRVERDSEFEKQLEDEDEQTFLDPR